MFTGATMLVHESVIDRLGNPEVNEVVWIDGFPWCITEWYGQQARLAELTLSEV